MTLVSLLAISAVSASPQTPAAPATPAAKPAASAKPGTSKSSKKKKRVKKPAALTAGKPAARTVRKPVARTVRKPVGKPLPPPADIPVVVESASVWGGCLESQDLPKLASGLGMEPTRLAALVQEMDSPASHSGCTAFVAATGGEAGVASVIFRHTDPDGESRTLAFHKTPDGIITTPAVCDCPESPRRVLSLPARGFSESINAVSDPIPANVLWQLDILVPHMISGLRAKNTIPMESARPSSEEVPEGDNFAADSHSRNGLEQSRPEQDTEQIAPEQTQASIDNYTVRVVVGHRGDDEPERLESVEIVEPVSGKRVNGAWWLDRPDGPGVIIGMDGVAYERLLWESPVKYTRSSRGVGVSVNTLRRRVPAKKGSAKSTVIRTIKVPGYHLGVDMTAAKGTDVHAVGDAKVSFAGRRGAFGNLIILDHGLGYQTYYAHLSKIRKGVKAGVRIARGEVIGLVGSTGRSTAPHLHFETRKDARYLDPFDESRQLGFWLLTADEQERLAMELLSAPPVVADDDLSSHARP